MISRIYYIFFPSKKKIIPISPPALLRLNSGDIRCNSPQGSPLTTARRQSLLEIHRRRLKICDLQASIVEERKLVDDLIFEIALTNN